MNLETGGGRGGNLFQPSVRNNLPEHRCTERLFPSVPLRKGTVDPRHLLAKKDGVPGARERAAVKYLPCPSIRRWVEKKMGPLMVENEPPTTASRIQRSDGLGRSQRWLHRTIPDPPGVEKTLQNHRVQLLPQPRRYPTSRSTAIYGSVQPPPGHGFTAHRGEPNFSFTSLA